ncbi:MAG: FAA hydrolase family protein [Phenylobacterium sp.]|nr:MAG: FAA hydrolase family protein [Phenylobacterium sp.]
MKLAAYESDDHTMIGHVAADGVVTPVDEIEAFWRAPDLALGRAGADPVGALDAMRQRPAVPPSARVICVGLNYRLHAAEANQPIPEVPVIFSRWTRTLGVDGQPAPAVEARFDWEGELGVVVGRPMFRVDEAAAADGVFGYVAFNDLSARTFQMRTSQWTMGKNSDASGPMSPIVTADEVGDPAQGLRLTTRVNDETMQDATTADMIFTVPQLIAYVSQVMTLQPGDLIATGTPAGVGAARRRFLKPGDAVEVEIERVGRVRTPIVAPPA